MTSTSRLPDPTRKIALIAGVLYLVTFAAALPQLKLFDTVIHDRDYVTGAGDNTALLWGCLLEIITAVACIGTAVALYPVTRRISHTAAIGFVTSRVVEAVLIAVGVISLLSVATLHDDYASDGRNGAVAAVTGHALVTMRQWTFLVGPGLIPGINALFLGYALYRARLVPRLIPTLGLVGAPILFISAAGTIFGAWDQVSHIAKLLALPIAAWELSLGVWLTVKGFRTDRPQPAVSLPRRSTAAAH